MSEYRGRGGFDGQRGGVRYDGGRGGRGGYDGGRGGRGGYDGGRGGRGSYDGVRGGGGRGGYDGGRGGFDGQRGGGRGGYDGGRSGFDGQRGGGRGGYDGRGSFDGQRGGGRGGYDGGRGSFDGQRGGGRGGFDGGRGGGRGGYDGRGGFDGQRGGGRGGFEFGRGGGGRGGSRGGGATGPKLEGNVSLSAITSTLGSMSIANELSLPQRPGFCEVGKQVMLAANCFDLDFAPKDALMYDFEVIKISFLDKPEEPIKMSPKDVGSFKSVVFKHMPPDVSYDGGRILFSLKPLEGVDKVAKTKRIQVKDPNGRGELLITYKIQEVQQISSSHLRIHVQKKLSTDKYPHDSVRFLDCVFRSICGEKSSHVIRNSFFLERPTKSVVNKLMNLHRGITTSIRPQWKVRMNIDMTCKAFFPPGNLIDTLYEKEGDRLYDIKFQRMLLPQIKDLKVLASFYKDSNGKSYSRKLTIKGISEKPANQLMITDINKTVFDYFKEHHNIVLKYPDLPCINTSAKREVYLPMELLFVPPFQTTNASKADLASEIVRCAAVKPSEKFNTLQEFVKNLASSQHTMMAQHQIKLSTEMVKVQGRVLPTPVPFSQGSWNQTYYEQPARKGEPIKCAVIAVGCRGQSQEASKLIHELPREARNMKINISTPLELQAYPADIKNVFDDLKSKGIEFAMFVMHDKLAYPRIKFYGDLTIGMVTQCVLPITITKPRTLSNILLKVNAKLGGINWTVPYCVSQNEIIQVFGVDVSHPSPGPGIRKSIAAVTGSISKDLMRYSVIVTQQVTNEKGNRSTREIVERLDEIVKELILMKSKACGDLPGRLVFYRDGISEGQFMSVLISELRYIQKACQEIRPDYKPGITFITVQKRHHIRFMSIDDPMRNIEPGTVVDAEVTHPSEFDFFLCSHQGIQGTSVPAHYYVLYDDNNWTASNLQSFTYGLTYGYQRCSKSVSLPAPTYYAHLAAYRAREWISGAENNANYIRDERFKINDIQKRAMFYL